MFFAMDANRISFDTNPPPTDISPAVIVQLDDLGVVVNLIRTGWPAIARGQLGDTELVLEGFFQPEGSSGPESESCVEPVKFKVSTQPAVSVSTQWRKMRQNMPWGMRGRIHWSIRIPDFNDKRIGLGSPTPVEIYFISTVKLPAFLQRGIPVGLCRKFLLPLRRLARDEDIGSFKDAQIKDPNVNNSTAGSSMSRSISDDEDGWVTYVAEKLHFQPNIQYDSRGGGSAHYWWVEPLGGLWLEAWVSDTAEKQKHVLNCYDLAAFTQAILPLGLTSPAHHVQMWHMDPFGYIKKTHLIGRGESNNPFCTGVGTNDKWVCGDNLLDRSGFGRHKFCTLRRGEKGADLVLDSTCRPLVGGPHAGTETLAEYITNSIDAASDLYKVPKAKWDEFWIATWKRLKRKHDVPGQLKLGEYAIKNTPPNPETRIGVESMFTPPEIFHPDWMTVSKDKEADNMFTFVSDELFADHNVTEPNLVVTGAALTTCWCVAIGEECLSLKISCCAYETVAQDLFRQTKQDLIGVAYSEEVPSEEEAAEHPDDVRTAWIEADKLKNQPKMNTSHRLAATDGAGLTLWVQGNFFVQITKDSSQGLKPVVSELQAFINELGVPKAPQIAVVDATKRTVAHKSTFEIDVSGFVSYPRSIRLDVIRLLTYQQSPDSFTPCNVTVQHNVRSLERGKHRGMNTDRRYRKHYSCLPPSWEARSGSNFLLGSRTKRHQLLGTGMSLNSGPGLPT